MIKYIIDPKFESVNFCGKPRARILIFVFHQLLKNPHYKDKVPSFPPKRLLRKSKDVIDERKKLLAEYMNGLMVHFNIFRDEYMVSFLKQDFGSVQISNLANL